jgi:hypothetical protein
LLRSVSYSTAPSTGSIFLLREFATAAPSGHSELAEAADVAATDA